jgi:prophage DNA circulation protein
MAVNDIILLPRASFQGLEFPVESVDVRGGIRTHLHEYPHWPSAALEKLGRKPYEITMVSNFQTTFAKWPGLWPKRLADLRDLFEAEASDYLVIPSIGKMWCCCTDWDQSMTAKILSGEKATFKFIEDSRDQFSVEKLVQVNVESLATNGQRFDTLTSTMNPRPSIFDQVLDAVNSVLAVIDTAKAYGGLVEAKILALANLCKEADQRIELQDASNHAILDALRDLWSSALKMLDDTQRTGGKIVRFRVPATMSVADVAALVYRDATRAVEILTLNPIDDAFAIPAGTVLKIYQAI